MHDRYKVKRADSGLYASLFAKIKALQKQALAYSVYKRDFISFDEWGGNKGYKAPGSANSGLPFTIFGEIAAVEHGTALSAAGTHPWTTKDGRVRFFQLHRIDDVPTESTVHAH